MPMYDYVCQECGTVKTLIVSSFEDADDVDDPCGTEGCEGRLTREFPRANFSVRGGTPKHHR